MDIFEPYVTNTVTPLCIIMETFNSDKGSYTPNGRNWHNYTWVYHAIFDPVRDKPIRLFEMGLGTTNQEFKANMGATGSPGASLRAWKSYFCSQETRIFGADIDRECLFKEEGIDTFYCDQMNPADIHTLWNQPALQEAFDIIIDDGLHEFEANRIFLENSLHKLAVGGVYVIEDVLKGALEQWRSYLGEFLQAYPNFKVNTICLEHPKNKFDNNLILIQRVPLSA